MTDRELTCQELVELVTDYLDDALDPADRARLDAHVPPPAGRPRFDAHVASCPGCDAHLAQMRTTLVIVGATAELEARPEVSGLLEALRGWKRAGERTAPAARPRSHRQRRPKETAMPTTCSAYSTEDAA